MALCPTKEGEQGPSLLKDLQCLAGRTLDCSNGQQLGDKQPGVCRLAGALLAQEHNGLALALGLQQMVGVGRHTVHMRSECALQSKAHVRLRQLMG